MASRCVIKLPQMVLWKPELLKGLPTEAEVTKEQAFRHLREMEIMRHMEKMAGSYYLQQKIAGFCHLYYGQESIPEGMQESLTMNDAYIGAYRIHCFAYKRGFTVKQIMAEMFGKGVAAATGGRGGSMHYYSRKNNFYGGNGIVGAQVPVGAGLAFAQKYKKEKNITVASYGDGAANQGQIYEALNMAGLWKLPIIFLCENNKYGMGTSV
jgi:pyruvate dehydrogenase E1 component alpha subunit